MEGKRKQGNGQREKKIYYVYQNKSIYLCVQLAYVGVFSDVPQCAVKFFTAVY